MYRELEILDERGDVGLEGGPQIGGGGTTHDVELICNRGKFRYGKSSLRVQ